MTRQSLLGLCLVLGCFQSLSAQNGYRNEIQGRPNSGDHYQIVNTLVYDNRTGQTTSGDDFGVVNHNVPFTSGTVTSMYVPHNGNMHLTFSPNGRTAFYNGAAWQNVVNPYHSNVRVNGTMIVEIATQSNGKKHVRAFFSASTSDSNYRYSRSGLIFEFTLNYGDVIFRRNY